MLERGTNLHNRVINRMGFVVDGSNDSSIVVMTINGLEKWSMDDCDVIKDEEDYDDESD